MRSQWSHPHRRGGFGLVRDESALGLPARVALTAGVLLWIPPMLAQPRRNAPVHDPRSGRPITPGPAAVVPGMSAFLAVLALACWGLAVLTT